MYNHLLKILLKHWFYAKWFENLEVSKILKLYDFESLETLFNTTKTTLLFK